LSPETLSFFHNVTIFTLSIFVGFSVVWRVTPALHSPLMAITNAVSSVIIVGAFLAVGAWEWESPAASFLGLGAIVLCMINITGGFLMTHRMVSFFVKKRK